MDLVSYSKKNLSRESCENSPGSTADLRITVKILLIAQVEAAVRDDGRRSHFGVERATFGLRREQETAGQQILPLLESQEGMGILGLRHLNFSAGPTARCAPASSPPADSGTTPASSGYPPESISPSRTASDPASRCRRAASRASGCWMRLPAFSGHARDRTRPRPRLYPAQQQPAMPSSVGRFRNASQA